jgi:hypothetical protein
MYALLDATFFCEIFVTATWQGKVPTKLLPSPHRLMPTGTLENVQHVIITIVNFSPVVLVFLLLTWSFLAFDLSFCRTLLLDGRVLQGRAISKLLLASSN